ncbi:methyl-accepting chemotaxis protein [Carboxydothermus islandicus]|uniref:Methyl-accepting chemotaxis protein n=1 Tax=Carboxydothermus islandicus TaxID=661089 RepID=A0A1L8D2K6_9THEO|nr:methyl-accepting chemotaxis protein [Carboxydothermus islandicus]GAV25410.1 methyl-accepting chemotaxis protein [Carboxydothermus islandicus]
MFGGGVLAKEKKNDSQKNDINIMEIRESFVILEKQIEKVINLSEAAVLEMGQAAEVSMKMVKNSKETIAKSLQEVLELNRKSIEAIGAVVDENARVLKEVEEYLHTLVEKVDGIFRFWGKDGQERLVELLKNVTRKTRVVALNASLEAARLGTSSNSFTVVAQEIQILISKTSEAIENLAEHNKVFEKKVDELTEHLGELEDYFLTQLRAANSKISESGRISREWGEKTKEIFKSAEVALNDLEDVILQGAVNFQFQDIIAQRLNNVIKSLKIIDEYLQNGEQGELLSKIEALYTSEEERDLHQKVINGSLPAQESNLLSNVEFF